MINEWKRGDCQKKLWNGAHQEEENEVDLNIYIYIYISCRLSAGADEWQGKHRHSRYPAVYIYTHTHRHIHIYENYICSYKNVSCQSSESQARQSVSGCVLILRNWSACYKPQSSQIHCTSAADLLANVFHKPALTLQFRQQHFHLKWDSLNTYER